MDAQMAALNVERPQVAAVPAGNAHMRVLAVIPGDGQGSSFVFARRQVEALIRNGVLVRTLFLVDRLSPFRLMREVFRLRQTIQEFTPDLVHAHYGTITAFVIAVASNRPIVITYRGSDLNSEYGIGFIRHALGHLLSELASLRAAGIICTSEGLRDRLWWRKTDAVVVPSGINLALFKPMDQVRARRILGWNASETVVLFNAGITPGLKGWDLVQRALEVARELAGPIRLVVLNGDTPPDQVPMYLNSSDCLVLASHSEGSPNIVKEALACNLPVVAVDVGDVAERLKCVNPSRIVRRDGFDMGQAIAEIVSLRTRSNGREQVLGLSEDCVSQKVLEVYASALQRRMH